MMMYGPYLTLNAELPVYAWVSAGAVELMLTRPHNVQRSLPGQK